MFRKTGPGMLIAAAFIGPGTVTTCLRAGVEMGYALLWALLLSVVATIVLQEMAGRLGLVTRRGLPTLIRQRIPIPWLRVSMVGMILIAIVAGNAAYEAGNIAGGVLGLEALAGNSLGGFYPWICGALAFLLLWMGSYRALEKVFTVLVLLMSLSFLITAVVVRPDPGALLRGLFTPEIAGDSLFTVLALIGTTVVPYNLFLYTALVTEKWKDSDALGGMRRDIFWSVAIGGIVSMAILVTAAGSGMTSLSGVLDLTEALEPVYGKAARYCMGIGLFAAGLSSAITAPLAAAYVARQTFDWPPDRGDWRFRGTWILVLLCGVLSLSLDFRPLEVIYVAQIANAIVLPVVAVFLWWMIRSRKLMGEERNSAARDLLAFIVIGIVTLLAGKTLFSIIQSL
ncbi:Nramp family divalent metal transporter [Robiginitalea sp. SC105]|uniref:Nramp family divalent metal transporter n=1 Tax=Robiginitalea sp. SC105 TaxID=2762332 RepID=UPI00163A8695|nr:Nramp family divalent metal transporter [Robiginitalea sp. SC105]MBC2840453.1 Nramp family divalent metal transporter [Robiginitalea sp. SC105]